MAAIRRPSSAGSSSPRRRSWDWRDDPREEGAVSRLVKLEKLLERGLDRLRHPQTGRELIEAIPEVLDDVEDRLEVSGGRGRVFPYQRVLVAFQVAAADRVAARALTADLPERIRHRLRLRGCEPPAELEVDV